jgi:hypothetical protein
VAVYYDVADAGHSEVVMKSAITKFFGAVLLAVSIGWVTGCDVPNEKKSVFQKAYSTETDSARPTEQRSEKSDEKKESKKPRAFSIRDRVDI